MKNMVKSYLLPFSFLPITSIESAVPFTLVTLHFMPEHSKYSFIHFFVTFEC